MLLGLGVALLAWLGVVLALVALGRREDARALAGFIPDCVVLLRRLLGDDRVPRRRKLVLVALAAYLATPVDLVPDLIPVAGQPDDAIVAALALGSLCARVAPSSCASTGRARLGRWRW